MKQLVLTEAQVTDLRNYLLEQPTKFALPVLQMIEGLFLQQNPAEVEKIGEIETVTE